MCICEKKKNGNFIHFLVFISSDDEISISDNSTKSDEEDDDALWNPQEYVLNFEPWLAFRGSFAVSFFLDIVTVFNTTLYLI